MDLLPYLDGTSGQALASLILDRIRQYGLDPGLIQGQQHAKDIAETSTVMKALEEVGKDVDATSLAVMQ